MKIKHLVLFSLILLISGCVIQENSILKWEEVKSYDVVIERDYLGVPHIIGKTDEDALSFAYAQAEDNWKLIHDSIPFIAEPALQLTGLKALQQIILFTGLKSGKRLKVYMNQS